MTVVQWCPTLTLDRDRERETERDRDRQRQTETDRQTDRQTDTDRRGGTTITTGNILCKLLSQQRLKKKKIK